MHNCTSLGVIYVRLEGTLSYFDACKYVAYRCLNFGASKLCIANFLVSCQTFPDYRISCDCI